MFPAGPGVCVYAVWRAVDIASSVERCALYAYWCWSKLARVNTQSAAHAANVTLMEVVIHISTDGKQLI